MSENNPWVTITHPKTGGVATVRAAAVPHFVARGWERADEKKAKSTAAKAAVTNDAGQKSGSTSEKE